MAEHLLSVFSVFGVPSTSIAVKGSSVWSSVPSNVICVCMRVCASA